MARHMIVPVDERTEDWVIERALALAAVERARITLLGMDWPTIVGVVSVSAPDATTCRRRHRIEQVFRGAAAHARRIGVDLETLSVGGAPLRALSSEARRLGADLVLISASPRQARWSRNPERLRRRTGCDCMVIHGDPAPVPPQIAPAA